MDRTFRPVPGSRPLSCNQSQRPGSRGASVLALEGLPRVGPPTDAPRTIQTIMASSPKSSLGIWLVVAALAGGGYWGYTKWKAGKGTAAAATRRPPRPTCAANGRGASRPRHRTLVRRPPAP